MRIVFWGSERESGVTSNMLILTSYLSCQKGYRITMFELAEEKCEIASYFSGKREVYAADYIRTLVRYQLYYVKRKEWKGVEQLTYVERNMDMVFVNVADRMDEEAKDLMRNAHLLVVNLRQDMQAFETFYAHYANLSARILLLIGNYYEDGSCDRAHLIEKYGMAEEQLAVIPNNPEYYMACQKRKMDRYFRRNHRRYVSALKSQFLKEVEKTAEQILEAVQKKR